MQDDAGRKVVKKAGLLGCSCGCGFLAFMGTIFYVAFFTNVCARMMGTETYPFKTAQPSHFDPFAALDEVRAKAGKNAKLVSIEASFVRSDGTLDLNAKYKPAPEVQYEFMVPLDKAPADAPPVGAGRGPDDVWVQRVRIHCYEPGQRRHVTRISGSSRSSYDYINEGMEIDRGTPRMEGLKDVPPPKMTTLELWKIALEKGANKDAVARIEYNDRGYQFSITGTRVNFDLDIDGKER